MVGSDGEDHFDGGVRLRLGHLQERPLRRDRRPARQRPRSSRRWRRRTPASWTASPSWKACRDRPSATSCAATMPTRPTIADRRRPGQRAHQHRLIDGLQDVPRRRRDLVRRAATSSSAAAAATSSRAAAATTSSTATAGSTCASACGRIAERPPARRSRSVDSMTDAGARSCWTGTYQPRPARRSSARS